MNPRQISTSIARRTSKALAIAALALGISASVFAPSAALAAPAQTDYYVDLVSGNLMFRKLSLWETAVIPVVLANNGTRDAVPVEMTIGVGPGFDYVYITNSAGWSCGHFERSPYNGALYATCKTTSGVGHGEQRSLGVHVHVRNAQGAWLATNADPNNRIAERNESNNGSVEQLAYFPG